MNKYRNVKCIYDGLKFDSKKEAQRYAELKLLEKCGAIQNLKTQVKFCIVPKTEKNRRARFYIADFVYTEKGVQTIEDVKSPITRRNPVYSLKKALVLVNYAEYNFVET